MPVETIHQGSGRDQTTIRRVVLVDAAGREHVHEFEGPPGGELEEYEYTGDGEPSTRALEELREFFNGGAG